MPAPLQGLAAEAPAVSPILQPDRVVFPFSNDDSTASFRTALERTNTSEYQSVRNPVAVLIGESALATNIQHIPEPTIVLLDASGPMVQHMGHYVDALRTTPNATAWQQQMGMGENSFLSDRARQHYTSMLRDQIEWWESQEVDHAMVVPSAFESSQALAQEKAIIPWQGDITSEEDMIRLGQALRKLDAVVTVLNLSNVIPYSAGSEQRRSFPNAAGYADMLAHLPITPNVPILTSSSVGISGTMMVESTGPFFGLDHLRDEGGDSEHGPVAIRPETLPFLQIPEQRTAADALVDVIETLLRNWRNS